jgi:2-C-methyl-D-erythritol 4-phosphate cytidylyltransferase
VILETVNRDELRIAQTPQGFFREQIVKGYELDATVKTERDFLKQERDEALSLVKLYRTVCSSRQRNLFRNP